MPAISSRPGTGTISTPSILAIKATSCPGRSPIRSRTSFGIETWNFDETVAVADMLLPFCHRCQYSKNHSLRQRLQARPDQRRCLRLRPEFARGLGDHRRRLRLRVAETDEGENRVLRRLRQPGVAFDAQGRIAKAGGTKRRRLVLELQHQPG